MCVLLIEFEGAPQLAKKERDIVLDDRSADDASERTKLVLRAGYKLFGVEPLPNFGGPEWRSAQEFFAKRDRLMHPKAPADLVVSDEVWSDVHAGGVWLMEQVRNFFSFLLRVRLETHDLANRRARSITEAA